jgi:hypothetical protein
MPSELEVGDLKSLTRENKTVENTSNIHTQLNPFAENEAAFLQFIRDPRNKVQDDEFLQFKNGRLVNRATTYEELVEAVDESGEDVDLGYINSKYEYENVASV